jgi:NADH-quinone oxidoreductase subunit H
MNPWAVASLRFLAALGLMLVNGVVMIYMLRKVLARLHLRLGPMDNGWNGMMQTIYDVLKLFTKEDPTPKAADAVLFMIAPAIVFVPSLMAYIVIPFSPKWIVADMPLGLLFILAILSIAPLGMLMAGWASNNKWSLIGAVRTVGQQLTYEVPLLIAALPVVVMSGSMNLSKIVAAQSGTFLWVLPRWYIWNVPAFVLFMIAGLMESKQTPFDLAEAESELVTGFATEYGSMRFGLIFLSEFSNTFIFAALTVTLFLGGWGIPFVPESVMQPIAPIVFMIKTYLVIYLLMVIRGTLPRVRVDQLLTIGWKFLLPISIAWVMITGLIIKLVQTVGGA